MVSTDPIADMLSRIRNAIGVRKHEVRMPHSKLKETVATELQKSGFIEAVAAEGEKTTKELVITINNPGENARINKIERISTPGRRAYASVSDIPRVRNGRGVVIVSTSKGVMTGVEASKQHLGGELICKVY